MTDARPHEATVMLVCGEPSGDAIAAELLKELKLLAPELKVFGVGGENVAAQGMEICLPIRELSVMGLWDVLRRLPSILGRLKFVETLALERQPDLLVYVDYPGFNLKLADRLLGKIPKQMYYISPKYWAWKRGRLKKLARLCSPLALIFPFEEKDYRELGCEAYFVGHPVLDLVASAPDRSEARRQLGIEQEVRIVTFCPGSRVSELKRHLPPLAQTAQKLQKFVDPPQILLQLAEHFTDSECRNFAVQIPGARIVHGKFHTSLRAADLALVASGTASLEAAALGTPHLVFYKMDAFSMWLAHRVVKLRWVSPVNISAGREVVPEFLQSRANGELMAAWCIERLQHRESNHRDALMQSIRVNLGGRGASKRVAQMIIDELKVTHGYGPQEMD